MAGSTYTIATRVDAVNAAGALLHLQAGGDRKATLLKVEVTNGSKDANDQLELQLVRTTGTAAGGTTLTPIARGITSVAAGLVPRTGAVTGTTSTGVIERAGFSTLGGWSSGWTPEEYVEVASGAGMLLELLDGPTGGAVNLVITATWEE